MMGLKVIGLKAIVLLTAKVIVSFKVFVLLEPWSMGAKAFAFSYLFSIGLLTFDFQLAEGLVGCRSRCCHKKHKSCEVACTRV